MDRQRCGPPGRASEPDLAALARSWVNTSCAREGFEVKITDPTILTQIASLLSEPSTERQAVGAHRSRRR